MRLYTLLKKIINMIKSTKTTLQTSINTKQNKTWKSLGSTTGTLTIKASSYSELKVVAYYGGVYAGTIVPVPMLNTTAKLFFVGYHGTSALVSVTTTAVKMYQQPTGYTATIYVYAR